MTKINITCDTCKKTHSVDRTNEIPPNVTELFCNWCPECTDEPDDYYDERYGYEPIPEPVNPDQLIITSCDGCGRQQDGGICACVVF